MLIAFQTIRGTTLNGSDGTVGTIADLLFDSETWDIRHVVVDTGKWLPGFRVLLPPAVMEVCDWQQRTILIRLTQEQVKGSPPVETQKPVSRQKEAELFQHYNVPAYWGPVGAALSPGEPVSIPLSARPAATSPQGEEKHLPNLRSAEEIIHYYIQANDGDIGHVEEFIVDDSLWAIRYLVVDTKNWLPARKVLISPRWIDSISWSNAVVSVNMTRQAIEESPEYDPHTPINRGYEEHLYDYYGQERYWIL